MIYPNYVAAIRESDLERKAEVAALVRPAIIAIGDEARDDPPLGTSRLGGAPDAPADFCWPTWKTPQGETIPLSCIAQVNLAELPSVADRELLPATGLLSFFYPAHFDIYDSVVCGHDEEEAGAFRVVYSDAAVQLIRHTTKPESLLRIEAEFEHAIDDFLLPAVPLRFELRNTFPDGEHPALTDVGYNYLKNGFDAHTRLTEVLDKATTAPASANGQPAHNQLLGYPAPIQTSVCHDAEAAAALPPSEQHTALSESQRQQQWELLFQIDSQDDVLEEMMWGDCGRLYFMMRREDLLARCWNRVWGIMQCS